MKRLINRKTHAIRKEQLLDRALLERARFAQARSEVSTKLVYFSIFKRLLLRWPMQPTSRLSSYFGRHPLLGLIFSALLATPARTVLLNKAKQAKPLIRWSILGIAFWQGMRLLRRLKTRRPE